MKEDKILLIKDRYYSLKHLFTGERGSFLTEEEVKILKSNKENKLMSLVFYLSPGDYHRFHSPFDFTIQKSIYIPGHLKRVDKSTLTKILNVYENNEWVTLMGKSPVGVVYMSIVGAYNVGSIKLTFD